MNAHLSRLRAVLLVFACAGPVWAGARTDAEVALAQANTAVAAAERAGGSTQAPQAFITARDQLLQAQAWFDQRAWEESTRASHRAHADARLAEARARQHKAETATADLAAALDTLRAELARNAGG